MTTIALIGGILLVFVAIAALIRGVSGPSRRTVDVLDQISGYGFETPLPDDERGGGHFGTELTSTIVDRLAQLRSASGESSIRRKLVAAGMYKRTPRELLTSQIGFGLLLGLMWLGLALAAGMGAALVVVGVPLFAALGFIIPSIALDRRVKARKDEIDRTLPELIDLLVVSVEAGIGFTGSLRLVAEQLEGPLAQELRLTLQEQSMGLSTSEAIKGLARRVDTSGVQSFARAIVQGESLGVSIGQILRNLASEVRKKRRALAEEKAQKAPIKMLFPLIFLIFPGMFVVLLLPALITIAEALGS